MNNLYRPACLTAAYAPLPKHLSIQPRQVMPSVNHEWLEKANAEAAYQAQLNNYDEQCLDIPF